MHILCIYFYFKALSIYNSYQTKSSLFVFCQIFKAHLNREKFKSGHKP